MRSIIRHKRTGGHYTIIGVAVLAPMIGVAPDLSRLNLTCGLGSNRLVLVMDEDVKGGFHNGFPLMRVTAASNLRPTKSIAVYIDEAGRAWARELEELMDGRFELTEGILEEGLPDGLVREYLAHGYARVGANSSRIALMAKMVVRLGCEVLRLRGGSR